ncbi:MAG: potassium-transporting ATPase subunit KdpB [Candidatus Sericytochromatia bacterium]
MTSTHKRALFEATLLRQASLDALAKFHPRDQVKNPVMLLVTLGALVSSGAVLQDVMSRQPAGFNLQIALWLWFTVYFANFAEALAEGRGKAQADSLRKARTQTMARRLVSSWEERVPATALNKGDLVVCETNDIIPGDGEIVEGIASVDESAITGESAPVVRESGGDRSAVTGGTRVISDRIVIRITSEQGKSFLDQMISLVEGAKRQRTPNEIALNILLITLTVVFVLAVITLKAFAHYSEQAAGLTGPSPVTVPVLVALLVCLIPTTIGGLLSAIGISGMDRLLQHNVLATSGKAVEAAGDVDVLLLDKTGTITHGNRMAAAFVAAGGLQEQRVAEVALLASLPDETPEGRSVVELAAQRYQLQAELPEGAVFVPFTAQTRMSGLDIPGDKGLRHLRKGAADAVMRWVESQGGAVPAGLRAQVDEIARRGSTPLVVAENQQLLGLIELKDVVKSGIRERFAQLRKMGIRTVMITGDNPLTAAAIAAEAGVDDFMAEATPEDKLARIRAEQAQGRLVAMVGDGTNDAPALAQSDVGVAMNSGTQAAREAGNMVDLDSNPTKLIEVVEIGKQLLMTRGSLTTFSIANDVAKYFAILPALFAGLYALSGQPGPLSALNIMRLDSPQSAILSAVIFNALIIVALIPLALRGVPYKPLGAAAVLRNNLLVYGLGGLLAPFLGIKLIDLLLVALHLV